ncbi:MAG TPA: nucleolar RNA-binding Nop10p family protein [Candidatus Nanoarchaeia archaeon]|nr:nucleolar RNA-binding Nop10p family protein [Candidatus Nanoarchaeia archaeon]
MRHIFRCTHCKKFTMSEICTCSSPTLSIKPLKYSPDDKFGAYRRKSKGEEYKKRGLL